MSILTLAMDLPFKIKKSVSSGFTLIELLIVMAILGVLAVGLVAAINPTDKINAANDARALSDLGVMARAAESYATARNGYYPFQLSDLQTSNELKTAPVPPSGYVYNFYGLPTPGCTAAGAGTSACNQIIIAIQMKSAKFTSICTTAGQYPFAVYNSTGGVSCSSITSPNQVKCVAASGGIPSATPSCP